MSAQLVVTGMHRSGTSLAASLLRAAGVDLGRDFAAGLGQPRGNFEDHDFYFLHEDILAGRGLSCFTVGDDGPGEIGPAFAERARALVAARADRPLWGWKDPRTCLFLDFWDGLLPQARYVFLYRQPVDVALSLWRRDIDLELRRDPRLAFTAWSVYNRRLLAFRERHPERCFVAHAPAAAADCRGFVRRVAAKLGLPLAEPDAAELLVPGALAPSCRPPRPRWEEAIPEALEDYRRLEAVADLDSGAEPPARDARELAQLHAAETLLFALLDAGRGTAPAGAAPVGTAPVGTAPVGTAPAIAEDLRREFVHLRLQEEALRRRLADGEAAVETLRRIEGSRAFALVKAWWKLRRRRPS